MWGKKIAIHIARMYLSCVKSSLIAARVCKSCNATKKVKKKQQPNEIDDNWAKPSPALSFLIHKTMHCVDVCMINRHAFVIKHKSQYNLQIVINKWTDWQKIEMGKALSFGAYIHENLHSHYFNRIHKYVREEMSQELETKVHLCCDQLIKMHGTVKKWMKMKQHKRYKTKRNQIRNVEREK